MPASPLHNIRGRICVNKLRLYARHGVDPLEQKVGNTFEVSAWVELPLNQAMDYDELATTVSYADIVEIIKAEMQIPSHLLEHVAGRIANTIGRKFPQIICGSVTVAKITPPISAQMESASITISWTAQP